MAYIWTTSHSVVLVMQIAEGSHAWVYAKVLHDCFGFHLILVYIEEELLSESNKVERSIL